jgi:predicted small lipoprotein YifL
MSKSIVSIVMFCLAYAVLAGCGTKGPLYIPEQRYPQGAENNSVPEDVKQHIMQANIHAPSRASL